MAMYLLDFKESNATVATEEDDWITPLAAKPSLPNSMYRTTQSHLFLCLPPEMRAEIWAGLDSSDCGAMRQVCGLFKWDMEEVLGVSAVVQRRTMNEHNWAQILPNNTEWLQSVIVRSLELRYAGKFMDYSSIVLKNPYMLQRLSLKFELEEFGDPVKVENLKRVLNCSSRLSSLQIHVLLDTCLPSTANFEAILSETLTCLERKAQLKDFKFSVGERYAVIGRGYRIMPDPEYTPKAQFPMQLSELSFQVPLQTRRQHLDWLAFLNTQTQLTKMELKIGLVSWDFFEPAVRNSVSSLRDISIMVFVPIVTVHRDQDLPTDMKQTLILYDRLDGNDFENEAEHPNGSFDWSMLSETRLDSLAVCSTVYMAVRSQNFGTIQIFALTKIEISSIQLTMEDLTRIFNEGTNLNSIHIQYWNLIADRRDKGFCLIQTIRIFILIAIALQERRFSLFFLEEASLKAPKLTKSIASTVLELVAPYNTLVYNGSVLSLAK